MIYLYLYVYLYLYRISMQEGMWILIIFLYLYVYLYTNEPYLWLSMTTYYNHGIVFLISRTRLTVCSSLRDLWMVVQLFLSWLQALPTSLKSGSRLYENLNWPWKVLGLQHLNEHQHNAARLKILVNQNTIQDFVQKSTFHEYAWRYLKMLQLLPPMLRILWWRKWRRFLKITPFWNGSTLPLNKVCCRTFQRGKIPQIVGLMILDSDLFTWKQPRLNQKMLF